MTAMRGARDERNARTSPAYRQPISMFWWIKRRSYLLFMLRETSCLFVAWFVVYLLLLVRAISAGSESYAVFLDWSVNPVVLSVNILALIFLVLHAVTWFDLAPRAMAVRVGGRRVPGWAVLAGHYAAWFVVSAGVGWVVLA